jgi:hypothetical protein
MSHRFSARELRAFEKHYARMTDKDLLSVNKQSIVPEAVPYLAAELERRAWTQEKIAEYRNWMQLIPPELPKESLTLKAGSVIGWIAAIVAFIYGLYDEPGGFIGMLIIAIIVTGMRAGARGQRNAAKKAYLDWLQQFARTLVPRLRRGEVLRYQVYLRPFRLDRAVSVPNPGFSELQLSPKKGIEDRDVGFETALGQALQSLAPTVALDSNEAPLGMGQILSDDQDWKSDFELLAHHASAIIVVPAHTDGVRLEVLWLREAKMWPKCIFIMPPAGKDSKFTVGKSTLSDLWPKTVRELRELAITIPDYVPSGMVFRLNSEGHSIDLKPYAVKSVASLVDAIYSSAQPLDSNAKPGNRGAAFAAGGGC